MDTNSKYEIFMAYNTAIQMLNEISGEEIKKLPEEIKAFYAMELSKQANRYDTGATA